MGAVGTITIKGRVNDVFGTVADANGYFAGSAVNWPTWDALSADAKKRAVVSGARFIARLSYAGTLTDPITPQPLPFPRTGIVDREGNAIGTTVVPDDVCAAAYEAGLMLATPATQSIETTGSAVTGSASTNVRVGDVSESSTGYYPSTALGSGRLPAVVAELLLPYLVSAELQVATGTDALTSAFTDGQFDITLDGLP